MRLAFRTRSLFAMAPVPCNGRWNVLLSGGSLGKEPTCRHRPKGIDGPWIACSTFRTVEVAGETYEMFNGRVKKEYFDVQFVRSSGPGGQNVNKVNTKVELRFHVGRADWLPERARSNLMETEKNRINKEGELVVSSSRHRTQQKNLEDALSKVQAMVMEACAPPPEPSMDRIRRAKKLARAYNESRIKEKKMVSLKKNERRKKEW